MGGHEERELSSVFQVLPQFALKARGIVSMRGWEMRWRILIMQSEGDEGGICMVAESCHQTSEAVGLMASTLTQQGSGKEYIHPVICIYRFALSIIMLVF